MEKGHTIPVLDHGFVRLIDYMGSDERILESARISYRSPSKGEEADKKLLHYLYRNRHTSPFEMAKITLNIKMPLLVMRQYSRHRTQSLNEVSARYTMLPEEFYIPKEWRAQDNKNKQSSTAVNGFDPVVYHLPLPAYASESTPPEGVTATTALKEHCAKSYELYENMVKAGIARELARMVLPVNIYTEIYATWDLKNLLHFISLRDDSHAQYEIQEYARAIKAILYPLFPWTLEAYDKYKWKLADS